ncbi:hypothetical protein [Microcystis sp. M31BS1]|uniref:hypothetical protein n=1 Tax=Microcystis sp. M31BS1 TaxID=2771186 RepID=UPI0025887969|nr:hypothetical protein [Microcystis sp. M31BS1]
MDPEITPPPGALPNEVADTQDIKASEGEYIIPADVVRYLGLDYIEKMIGKAKDGLMQLQENGRIGGQLPKEPVQQEVQPLPPEESPAPMMAAGGLVTPQGMKQSRDQFGNIIYIPIDEQTTEAFQPMSNYSQKDKVPDKNQNMRVDRWTPDKFVDYASRLGGMPEKVAKAAVSSFVPMGLGAVAVRAQENYMKKNVPSLMDRMLSEGKDLQGNALTPEQRARLSGARQQVTQHYAEQANRREEKPLERIERFAGRVKQALGVGQRDKSPTTTTTAQTRQNTKSGNTSQSNASAQREAAQRDKTPAKSESTKDKSNNPKGKSSDSKGKSGSSRFAAGGLITRPDEVRMPTYMAKGGLITRK